MKTHKLAGNLFLFIVFSISQSWSADKAYPCRIVDYGADMGSGYYNDKAGTAQTTYKEDVDGDGSSTDDCIAFWEYKDASNPLSPLSPTAITYDNEATNARFYGGLTAFFNKTGMAFTEGMINTNHELRDDWNIMSVHSSTGLMERAYGFWFWDKADFLNGGNTNTVTFDANSTISFSNFRLSTQFLDGRWVVRDGTQFYISEAKFGTTTTGGLTSITGRSTQILNPTTTKWAEYNPVAPYDIRFKNPSTATFSDHVFTNVTAVGAYVARDDLSSGNSQLKWHAFEVNAVVTRPEKTSFYTNMVEIPANGTITNAFNISTTEVSFELWQKIYRWAVSNQYCSFSDITKGGYVFDKDGDMGSMDVGNVQHTAYEPATDMTWYDAVLWCNALSDLEGLTPCYYADAAKTIPLKIIKDRTDLTKYTTKFNIYVDYTKNGYRLPTLAEWTAAAGSASSGWVSGESTKEVGTSAANSYGVYDMIGNVWEYCWDTNSAGDYFNPVSQNTHTVVGGAFSGTANNPTTPIKKWGDIPFKGNPNIGFRIVKSATGAVPPSSQNTASMPIWTITEGVKITPEVAPSKVNNILEADLQLIKGTKTYKTPGDSLYENDNTGFVRTDDANVTISPFRMSKYETSYSKWREIYNWAEINGYTFDGDGDMGCMDYRVGAISHDITEPVTEPNWNDILLWSNALSEYEGKTPVYYADPNRTIVLKTGLQWRIAMEQRYTNYPTYTNTMYYARYEKDGYRLPTDAEWEVAYRSGLETKAVAGTYPKSIGASKNLSNSDNHTWDVATGTPNSLGIYNLHGNVSEYVSGAQGISYYLSHNPKDDNVEGLFGIAIRGGSFGSDYQLIKDVNTDKASATRYWTGFRVVRCDSSEHPEFDVFVPDTVIKFNKANFNPLTGQTFRNNLMRTGEFTKTGVSVPNIKEKWTFTTGAAVTSSPVVVNGILYIGSDDKNVYAIDANTGVQKWKYSTGNFVRSSATILNDSLFIGSNDGYLYCLKASDGTLIWKKKAYTSGSVKACPTVMYNTVFATWHGMFEATNTVGLDIKTGQIEKFRYRASRLNEGAIAADSTQLYAAAADNMIASADVATEQNIFYKTGDHNKGSMVVLDDTKVLYARETAIGAYSKTTGSAVWTVNVGIGKDLDASPLSTPAVATVDIAGVPTQMIYWATLKNSIMALKANGTQLWHRTDFAAPFNSAPVVANNVIYVGCDDNKMYALNAEDGSTIWSYTTGGTIQCSPWVEDGAVYFSSNDGKVYAIGSDVSTITPTYGKNITIYPNPAVNYITVNSSEEKPSLVRICNLMGQVVKITSDGEDLKMINIGGLNQGVYTLEVLSGTKSIGKRLFIKK
ncbi:MAG: SUMF1/EgtB/PvdO family nonheme iron enzyme [Bacteroidales bacterium]|nr:SUMF1/EgtB/PvdO family nonheme iron enzyme [Bacteroidales bacterium]